MYMCTQAHTQMMFVFVFYCSLNINLSIIICLCVIGMLVCDEAVCMPGTMCADHKDSFVELMLSFNVYMGLDSGPQACILW